MAGLVLTAAFAGADARLRLGADIWQVAGLVYCGNARTGL
jgi:hypothetical protein